MPAARRPFRVERLEDRLAPAALTFRDETGANQAEALYGVTGAGTTVAILDRGIDYAHPDFRKPDGTTRIKWLLDLTGQNWDSPTNPPPVEYTEAQINAALTGGPPLPTRDAVGHGTPTAGLAAGNGRGTADRYYRGMAPAADLIVVKVTSEGAPAHDGQPAEAAFNGDLGYALAWLDQKIALLNQPCVAIINSGVQWGPIDGTSAVSRQIDQVFGLDRPGRVYVAPSGDEGAYPSHARTTFTNTADGVVRFANTSAAPAILQLWYSGAQPAEVTVQTDDGATSGPVGPGGVANQNGFEVFHYPPGTEFYPWASNGGDRAVWVRITGHATGGSVRLRGLTPGTGTFDVYVPASPASITFTDNVVPGRLTDYAATRSAVVAGAHVLQTDYIDIDNVPRSTGTGEGAPNAFWLHSSGGPSRDGRPVVVDVTAPGHSAFAAYAAASYWTTFRFNLVQGGNGFYGRAGATSGSAPIVTGGVALLLQVAPELTARQVKQILQQTARADSFTGAVPNPDWGYGKLDALAAVQAAKLLRVDVSAGSVSEGAGAGAATVTVTRRGVDTSAALTVTLVSSDPASATLPMTVIIPANQRTATVPLTAIDNTTLDGNRTVTLSASAAGYFLSPGGVTITDDDLLVTTVADAGPGSLRQALLDANARAGRDVIRFAAGSGVQTINLLSPLPAVTGPVVIDGTTQPGYFGSPVVNLNGVGAGASATGLTLAGGGSTVRGLAIYRFGGAGVALVGDGNTLVGCVLGADPFAPGQQPNGTGVRVTGSGNAIGGPAAADANRILFSTGVGVLVAAGTGTAIRGNRIDGNGGLGIDLGGDGVTPNDPGDADAGPNDRQNFPTVFAAQPGATTRVTGGLGSRPNTAYTLDFFTTAGDPTGYGEGGNYLGSAVVVTDAAGRATFDVTVPGKSTAGDVLTATATDPAGNTSEFSATIRVGPPAVAGAAVNGGAVQRSRVTAVTVTFGTTVAFAGAPAAAFTLVRTGGAAVSFTAAVTTDAQNRTVVTLTNFGGLAAELGSLADGRYTLTALAAQITAAGQALDGDGDGAGGDNYTFGDAQGLFRYFGDVTGDRTVNGLDFGPFRQAFGTGAGHPAYLDYLDINGDGAINGLDFGPFRQRFGIALP